MLPKERIVCALNFKEPDDFVPSWEVDFQLYKELLGKEPVTEFKFDNLSDREKERAIHHNAEILVETADRLGLSAICSLFGYWEVSPGQPACYWIREEKWRIRLIKVLKEMAGEKYLIIGCSDSTIGIPPGDKLEHVVTMMYEEPIEMLKMVEKRFKDGLEEGIRAVEAGAEAVLNASDIAFNNGCFFTPSQFDTFIGPYLEKWANTFKKESIYTIYHTDGNIENLMDKLAVIGINALQCIDPLAGMDIISLKERYYGQLVLIGNVNTVTLQFGTVQEVEKESKRILEGCKKGGGYIFGACNAIFKGLPLENYLSMVEAKKIYGRYKQEEE